MAEETVGCRAGDACPFVHDTSVLSNPNSKTGSRQAQQGGKSKHLTQASSGAAAAQDGLSSSQLPGRRFNHPPVASTKVVLKPVPAANPREFQISQLRRRFSPSESVGENGDTVLAFTLPPSDPDFPFELVGLECALHIPGDYSSTERGKGKPRLKVQNTEMGEEWRDRIERGFVRIADGGSTLLGMMNALDRQLEGLLTGKGEDVVTLVANARPPGKGDAAADVAKAAGARAAISPPQQSPTAQERSVAAVQRESEIRQLEARVGRLPLFSKAVDGLAYTIPITPRKHGDLPVPLQGVRTIKLYVPALYPLEQCRIELLGVSKEAAKKTERGFERREGSMGTLMGNVNYLAQNMHALATEPEEEIAAEEEMKAELHGLDMEKSTAEDKISTFGEDKDDRNHVKIIPRPPEWLLSGDDVASSDSEYSDSYDTGDEFTDDETKGLPLAPIPETSATTAPERGISLSLPLLELYGIELLELTSLSITIKCERCKDVMDISNLRSGDRGDVSKVRNESCKKCATALSVGYRRELMHANSARAGYLDLEGCTVVDMLPSNFIPTCSECSTTYPAPGVVSVRGESSMAVCRECHRKMSFKIPEVKFLLVSASIRTDRVPVRKKPRENLGIVAGTELPRRGRCGHYNKSYRWFRFSCCSKVFSCDKCHDEGTDHPNEHANRMICGYCSREQNYRPEDCGICHSSLIAKRGSGFWEGGKGTRDKSRMSRKDPRKYKRRPGGIARKIKAGGTGVVTGKG